MSVPTGASVSCTAYAKMVLHALKHPQDAVCGLLVGPEESELSRRGEVLCVDSIPLLHTHMLHPQLRLGVELVEAVCEMPQAASDGSSLSCPTTGKAKQKIVGFYYSDILTFPEKPPTVNKEATHICKVLRQHYPSLLLCLLDFRSLSERKPVTTFWLPSGSSWKRLPAEAVRCSKAAIEMTETAVANATYMDLSDLDDHLCDPNLSPLNRTLFADFADLIEEDSKLLRGGNLSKTDKDSIAQESAAS